MPPVDPFGTILVVCEVVFDRADGHYQFSDVLPGHYEVLIDNDVFCWENPSLQGIGNLRTRRGTTVRADRFLGCFHLLPRHNGRIFGA